MKHDREYFSRERSAVDGVTRALNRATRAKRIYNSTATQRAIADELSKRIILEAKGGAGR